MTSSRTWAFAAVVSMVGLACATATSPITGGGGDGTGTGDGGNTEAGSPYTGYGGDSGASAKDSGLKPLPPSDGGTVTPVDSGTTTPVDSGTTTTSTFCVGQTSSQENDYGNKKYDDWCYENSDFDNTGSDFACADDSDCTTQFTVPACCYKPKSGGDCQFEYGNTPQCVVQ